ncbi:MAG: hypothetical protein R3312_10420 [Gammaproteobacteria bacterium]|nr:hypothetical protein [Gammaproteobacteria bacterium]
MRALQHFTMLMLFFMPAVYAADMMRIPYQFMEEGWLTESREDICEMRHELPLFGHARFIRHQTEAVQLEVESLIPAEKTSQARIYSVEPSWKGGGQEILIAEFSTQTGFIPITFSRPQAMKVFYSLYQGRAVRIEMDDLGTGEVRMLLELSPIDFMSQTQAFETCVSRLQRQGQYLQQTAQLMIDEERILSSEPAPEASPLRLKPVDEAGKSLSYQYDSKGKPAPVRIRVP